MENVLIIAGAVVAVIGSIMVLLAALSSCFREPSRLWSDSGP